MNPFDEALAILGKRRLLEDHRDEIERAIKNVKRSAWDKWFRRQWYRAAAMRNWQRRQASDAGRCFG